VGDLQRRLLGAFGLVRRSELAAANARVEKLNARAAQVSTELDDLRKQLKAAGGEAARQGARLAAAEERADKEKARAAELQAHVVSLRERNDKEAERTREIKTRFEQAAKAVEFAQSHLMATEVKLDIIEGAINVLDRRTRGSSAPGERSDG
jgi:chromosome segregation ATPase